MIQLLLMQTSPTAACQQPKTFVGTQKETQDQDLGASSLLMILAIVILHNAQVMYLDFCTQLLIVHFTTTFNINVNRH